MASLFSGLDLSATVANLGSPSRGSMNSATDGQLEGGPHITATYPSLHGYGPQGWFMCRLPVLTMLRPTRFEPTKWFSKRSAMALWTDTSTRCPEPVACAWNSAPIVATNAVCPVTN